MKKKKLQLFDVINALVMTLLSLVCVYPLLYVLFASFSDPTALMAHKGLLFWPLGAAPWAAIRWCLKTPTS